MINSTHNGEALRIGHLRGIPWEVGCYSIHTFMDTGGETQNIFYNAFVLKTKMRRSNLTP